MRDFQIYEIKQSVFENNDREADKLRAELKKEKTFFLNLMSSPGSGKTTTLLRTIDTLAGKYRMGIMEADIDSSVDAKTIAETGVRTIQLHTGGMCHLDAGMSRQGLDNPELLHFRDYAAGFFWNSSYRKTMARLGQVRGADALARAYSDINLAYFIGRMDTVDCGADTLRRWKSRDNFTYEYICSMCADEGKNFTEFVLGPF